MIRAMKGGGHGGRRAPGAGEFHVTVGSTTGGHEMPSDLDLSGLDGTGETDRPVHIKDARCFANDVISFVSIHSHILASISLSELVT